MAERTVIESGVIRMDASGRRHYSVKFKRRLARLTLEPGASVAGIARAHRINANQLFKWRRWYLRQPELPQSAPPEPEPEPGATLLPVVVAPSGRAPLDLAALADAPAERAPESSPAELGQIEVEMGRTRVRVSGSVDPTLLAMILRHVERR